jgi:hypothetical protein
LKFAEHEVTQKALGKEVIEIILFINVKTKFYYLDTSTTTSYYVTSIRKWLYS